MKKYTILTIIVLLILSTGCEKKEVLLEKSLFETGEELSNKDESVSKDCFWKDGKVSEVSVKYMKDGYEDYIETEGCINVELTEKKGHIYNLTLNSKDGYFVNKEVGAFYVMAEKIYLVEKINEGKTAKEDMILVFQKENKEMDDGSGMRCSIKSQSDRIIFNRQEYNVESGFNQTIQFDKSKEIKLFRSQYGAGRDLLEIIF